MTLVLVATRSASGAAFIPLGDLPDGIFRSEAFALSSDGTTVVGSGHSIAGQEAFTWTASGGFEGIGNVPGQLDFGTRALGVSGDGRVVAGYGTRSVIPWAWTSDEGIRAISESDGTATAANADGRFVVGQSWATGESQAVLWNLEDGTERLLGSLRDDDGDTINSRASAVSDDGSIVVGTSWGRPFVWDEHHGMREMGVSIGPEERTFSSATVLDLSGDGRFAVGSGTNQNRTGAFIWTEAGGFRDLGILSGYYASSAEGVSADGSIVVGTSWDLRNQRDAFIWDSDHGMRRLKDVLSELGVAAEGWRLNTAVDISADGTRIAGTATNPNGQLEAFLIVIPEPTTFLLMSIGLVALAIRRGSTTGGSPRRSAAPRPLCSPPACPWPGSGSVRRPS